MVDGRRDGRPYERSNGVCPYNGRRGEVIPPYGQVQGDVRKTAGGVEPRPYTPNIEPHSPAFQSESGSEKRSRDNAIFRGNFHGTAFAWFILTR